MILYIIAQNEKDTALVLLTVGFIFQKYNKFWSIFQDMSLKNISKPLISVLLSRKSICSCVSNKPSSNVCWVVTGSSWHSNDNSSPSTVFFLVHKNKIFNRGVILDPIILLPPRYLFLNSDYFLWKFGCFRYKTSPYFRFELVIFELVYFPKNEPVLYF